MFLNDDVYEVIRTYYDKMTDAERTVADYFLNQTNITDFATASVSKKLFVSKATLTRFARRCGFEGYSEFVYNYKSNQMPQISSFSEMTETVIRLYQLILNRTTEIINEKQLQHISEILINSPHIYIYANGSSGHAAQELRLRLMRLGVSVEAIVDPLILQINASLIQEDSVVIGLSISAKTKVVVDSMKIAKQRGATTIMITANRSKKLTEEYDEVVRVAYDKRMGNGISISSQFPLLIICDIIFSYALNSDFRLRKSNYDITVETLRQQRINKSYE